MAGKRMARERRSALLDEHKRMRKLCGRLRDRLGRRSSCDGELDRLSEMTEIFSARMQQPMERRSKTFSAIGNILERMANAQNEPTPKMRSSAP